MIFIGNPLIQEHDLLILRATSFWRCIEPQSPQSIVPQRFPNPEPRTSAAHPVIQTDYPLLALGEIRVGSYFQRDELVPVGVIFGRHLAWSKRFDLQDPGQQEVLESLVDVAEGADV